MKKKFADSKFVKSCDELVINKIVIANRKIPNVTNMYKQASKLRHDYIINVYILTWHQFLSNDIVFFQKDMLAAVEFDVILVPHVMEAIKTNFPQTWSMKNKITFLVQWFNDYNNMYQFH